MLTRREFLNPLLILKRKGQKMAMTQDKINEAQMYLQMYDKGIVSKKTVLAQFGIDAEQEQKEIEKDIEFDKKRYQGICSPMGGCGAREHA
jgi:hypothetical protein